MTPYNKPIRHINRNHLWPQWDGLFPQLSQHANLYLLYLVLPWRMPLSSIGQLQ